MVVDTSGLISLLERSGRPRLIQDLRTIYGEIIIPHSVKEEFDVKSKALDKHVADEEITVMSVTAAKGLEILREKYPALGRGELDVILLGLYLQSQSTGSTCVLDDRRARNVARTNNVNFTGVLGLLNALEAGCFLSPVEHREIVKALRDSGVYLTKDDVGRDEA